MSFLGDANLTLSSPFGVSVGSSLPGDESSRWGRKRSRERSLYARVRRNAHSPFAFSRCVIGDGHHDDDDGVSSVAGAGKVPHRSVFCHACCCCFCCIPLRFQACRCILSISQVPPFAFSSSNRFAGSDNSSFFFFFKTSSSEIRCSCSAGSPYYPVLLSSINCSFFFFKACSSEVRCSCSTGLLYYPVLLSSIFCGK